MVELSHDHGIRVIASRMMCFVKDQEAYISTEIDVSMPERVEKNLRGGDDNPMGTQNVFP